MRGIVHCVALAMTAVTLAVYGSGGVGAISAAPAPQAGHQAAAPPAKAARGEVHGKVSPGTSATPGAHQPASPLADADRGTASARAADERAGRARAADPLAAAAEAVGLVNRIMAEQASKRTRPSAGKTADAAGRTGKPPLAPKVRPRPLLNWNVFPISEGVALVWDNELVPRPASTDRNLGIRLTWPR